MLKNSLVLVAGLAVAFAVWAVGSNLLRQNHPDTYIVRKGDTLWSISALFLKKPWLWPEIWQANPQVKNPHLIYPGDLLSLDYLGSGQPIIVLKPRAAVTPLRSAIPTIPLADIQTYLQDLRVFPDRQTLTQTPYVVGFENNQMLGVPGQFVYVMNLKARPGERFAVVRPTHVFTTFNIATGSRDQIAQALDNNVDLYNGPWHRNTIGDGFLGRGHTLGYEVQVIGTIEALRGNNPTTTLLRSSTMEIRKGDRILPLDTKPYDANYYPHPPKTLPPNMRVIAFTNAMNAVGSKQVVALSAGSAEGVNNGQTYAIYQPGERIIDEVASSGLDHTFSQKVKLPAEFIGHVMVFRTFDHVSYGLIMDSQAPVHRGDMLRLPG
ncbi:MAG TPA: LysM peptidoglycan-binding domain-containing protein [Mizugakiibacter sp.]|nr:LysM peptidoglycan-binding domain-containing protein [Mizugakiibacter sp.]